MRLLLDAGALIGIDRDDPRTVGLLALARRNEADVVTIAPVVGQAWRSGSRQARLARALASFDVKPADLDRSKRAGLLLAQSGSADVVDALIVGEARSGDRILTSDPDDIGHLVDHSEASPTVTRV